MGDPRTRPRTLLGILLLGLAACEALRLERVDPPQLGLGLEPGEPAEASLAPGTELGHEAPPAPAPEVERSGEAALADGAGTAGGPAVPSAEPLPASQPAPRSPARPELLRAGEVLEGVLVDPPGNLVAHVSDLLVDPDGDRVLGVFAARAAPAIGDGPFVSLEGFVSWERGEIWLSHSHADALAVEQRELETAELFRQRELETIEGEVVLDPEVVEGELVITLVDDNNHRHRVVLGPRDMLENAQLKKGSRVRILGISMRDETGPFEVAARLTVDGQFELPLRDDQGRTAWGTRAEPPRGWRFRELLDREVHVGGRKVGTLVEVEIRPDGGVAWALLESGDRLLRLPWGPLARTPGASWLDLPLSDWQAWTGKGARDAAANDDAPR